MTSLKQNCASPSDTAEAVRLSNKPLLYLFNLIGGRTFCGLLKGNMYTEKRGSLYCSLVAFAQYFIIHEDNPCHSASRHGVPTS
jgi:hypothetical protein